MTKLADTPQLPRWQELEGPEIFELKGLDPLKAFGYRQAMRAWYLTKLPTHWRNVTVPGVDIYYFGHHKCASHWIRWFLFYLAPYIQYNYQVYHGRRFANFTSGRLKNTLHLFVNSDVHSVESMPADARAFHVIRDPRDTLVSEYFSRKKSHAVWSPWHVEMREYLNSHSMDEGLIYLMDNHLYFMQMENWPLGKFDNVLDVKYEDMLADQVGMFGKILDHLGVKIPAQTLERIVEKCSFEKLSGGRRPGVEKTDHHYRKGVAGDWENYLKPGTEVREVFYDRFGPLMQDLGYEL